MRSYARQTLKTTKYVRSLWSLGEVNGKVHNRVIYLHGVINVECCTTVLLIYVKRRG